MSNNSIGSTSAGSEADPTISLKTGSHQSGAQRHPFKGGGKPTGGSTSKNVGSRTLNGTVFDTVLEAHLERITSMVKPTPNGYVRCEVNISPLTSSVFLEYISASYTAMEAATSMRGGEMQFTRGAYARYIVTIVESRVAWSVAGKGISPHVELPVPAFINLLLNQIGPVTNDKLGLTLVPKFVRSDYDSRTPKEEALMLAFFSDEAAEVYKPMSPAELMEFGYALRMFRGLGFVFAMNPYSTSRQGNLEFMALQVLNDLVMSQDDSAHPTLALLASVVDLQQVQSVMLPRVSYGTTSFFRTLIGSVAAPIST